MNIQIILFDGFDELDAIAPFEVLRHAAALGADLHVNLVTLDGSPVTASHGLQVQPHAKLDVNQDIDILIVPGGGWGDRAERGAWAETQKGDIPGVIAHLHHKGVTIGSVCTGAMLVATAGLLKHRSATTHHVAKADLANAGANLVNARVVDDGNIVTAGGVTSGLDLALWLVERFFDPQLAHAVEQELEYERRGTVWRSVWRSQA